MKLFSKFKRATGKKLFVLFALFLSLSVGGVLGANALNSNGQVDAATNACGDNSANSIIYGGADTRTKFVSDVKGSTQLQRLYADSRFGSFTSGDYSNFINNAKAGWAYDNATIVVDGKVVATNAISIGNTKGCQGPNPIPYTVSGKTYWGNYDKQGLAFAQGTHAIPVEVLFDGNGKMKFAVMMKDCGNAIHSTPTTPPTCKELNAKNLGNNQYELTTSINAGTAKESVNKVVYTFSDGRKAITSTSGSSSYKTTVTLTKNVTVTATVYVNVPGGGVSVSSHCTKQLTFTPPAATYACTNLTLSAGKVDQSGNTPYTLAATATAKNATIKSYTFTFGDGKSVTSTSNKSTHTYAPGNYTAKVLVTFVTNTGKTVTAGNTGNCVKSFTVKPLATSLACVSLTANKGFVAPDGSTSYTFTAKATASNATISSYKFDFGDNNATQTVSSSATSVTSQTHVYAARTADYTAKVTVTGKDIYGKTIVSTVPACQTSFNVKPVATSLACVSLTANKGAVDQTTGATTYTFTATASATNATIESYTFDFGDGATQAVPTGATTATSSAHTYAARTADYTAKVTVTGTDVNGKTIVATAPTCQVSFNVKTPECKPGVPVGSPECQPSSLVCVNLVPNAGAKNDDGSQSYTFTATASATNATITGYTFDFGDQNATQTVATGATTATSDAHTYAPGTYTAKVTVTGKDADGNAITAPANAACSKPITVSQLPTPGITITKTVDGKKSEVVKLNTNYEYEITVTNTGETDLTNAVVTDTPEDGVVLATTQVQGTVTNNTWTFTIPALAKGQSMTFKLIAQLTKATTNPVDNEACVTDTEVNNNQPVCDHATVTTTPQVLPAVLVNTGAGSVLGIFAASAVFGTIGHRIFLSRRLSREG